MVDHRLDLTFRASSDPTRRGMLASLALGEQSIGELGEPYAMTFAGASKHVRVLEQAGLIVRRKAGRKQICALNAEPLGAGESAGFASGRRSGTSGSIGSKRDRQRESEQGERQWLKQ